MDSLLSPINILFLILSIGILVYSAILHEIAHGYVADRLGDPTARLLGRLTLNPLPHIDPFLSILLPILLIFSQTGIIFGGAKPVPIDPYNLKEGRKDIALVSLAGPATNIILVIIGTLVFKLLGGHAATGLLYFVVSAFEIVVHINLSLAIFNLLPIPPLDGSKIFALILPEDLANTYLSLSSFGTLFLLILLMFPIGGFSLMSVVSTVFSYALNFLGI